MNRFHYFFLGLLVLFVGIEFRFVDSFVLNEKTTSMLADKMGGAAASGNPLQAMFASSGPTPRKTVQPPQWMGWCLLSLGGVLVLHSLAMPKPG